MEKYNVQNHLFYDGYDLDNRTLGDPDFVKKLLEKVNQSVFNGKGVINIIPYFRGKDENDGGISGFVLGDNFHFTCHTFSFKKTVFVDYFGDDNKKDIVEDILLSTFDTKNYDMGSKYVKGNFGKHIIFKASPLSLEEVIPMVKVILKEINMTPIEEMFVKQKNEECFDVLQLIAESHISFHRTGNEMVVDTFSCKNFNVKKLLELFNLSSDYIEVNRGIKYINNK